MNSCARQIVAIVMPHRFGIGDALERIRSAAGELEGHIDAVEAQERQHRELAARVQALFGALREHAQRTPDPDAATPPRHAEATTMRLPLPPSRFGTL